MRNELMKDVVALLASPCCESHLKGNSVVDVNVVWVVDAIST